MSFGPSLLVVEGILGLIGGLIGLSIGYFSLTGYRKTGSPTLLRLAFAFFFLFVGFTVESIANFSYSGYIPLFAISISILILLSVFLETIGYFFLAFSHVIDVRSSKRFALLIPLIIPLNIQALQMSAILGSISFYLLLYGSLETGLSYFRVRKVETLLISLGLSLLAISEFVGWVSYLNISDAFMYLLSILLRVVGFSSLLLSVIKFVWKKETI